MLAIEPDAPAARPAAPREGGVVEPLKAGQPATGGDGGPRLTLYGSGRSRWVRPLWMLRELGVPFRAVEVDRAAGGLDHPDFRALNPRGKIPVLVDERGVVCESGAILLYLGDRFPESGLVPPAGSYDRGLHDQWMFQLATELEAPVWRLHRQVHKADGSPEVAVLARRDAILAAGPFEDRLGVAPFLLGERFTAADIFLGHLLTWEVVQDMLPAFPALAAYRDRLVARPGFPAHLYR